MGTHLDLALPGYASDGILGVLMQGVYGDERREVVKEIFRPLEGELVTLQTSGDRVEIT